MVYPLHIMSKHTRLEYIVMTVLEDITTLTTEDEELVSNLDNAT